MEEIGKELNDAILEHMMNPKNYGKLETPNGVGIGYSDKTNEYVVIYLKVNNNVIEDIKFMAVGCTDTIVSGSIFTEMVKGSDISFGNRSAIQLMKNLERAPEAQRACAETVIKGYEAAIINLTHRANGSDEELYKLKIGASCETENE